MERAPSFLRYGPSNSWREEEEGAGGRVLGFSGRSGACLNRLNEHYMMQERPKDYAPSSLRVGPSKGWKR
jgi:hypothetical protein